jgi:hypothetical protein
VLRKVWTAVGYLVYLSIAFVLPVITRILGVFSDVPSTWPRLAVPLVMVPFLMGFAQALFGGAWRLMLWLPAAVMFVIAVIAIIDDFSKTDFLKPDLIFWPVMMLCYLAFSYLGKITRDRLTVSTTAANSL